MHILWLINGVQILVAIIRVNTTILQWRLSRRGRRKISRMNVDRIYPIELEIKYIPDRTASYRDIHLEIDSDGWLRNFTIKDMISIFHLYVATFQQRLHMEYIYLSVDPIFQNLWFL